MEEADVKAWLIPPQWSQECETEENQRWLEVSSTSDLEIKDQSYHMKSHVLTKTMMDKHVCS